MNDLFGFERRDISLRDYQQQAVSALDDSLRTHNAPLLVLPTGGGKTRIACALMQRETERGGRSLFLAPRRELIYQTSRSLRDLGIMHGVVMAQAEHLDAPHMPVQVGSIDTLVSRALRKGRTLDLPITGMESGIEGLKPSQSEVFFPSAGRKKRARRSITAARTARNGLSSPPSSTVPAARRP